MHHPTDRIAHTTAFVTETRISEISAFICILLNFLVPKHASAILFLFFFSLCCCFLGFCCSLYWFGFGFSIN